MIELLKLSLFNVLLLLLLLVVGSSLVSCGNEEITFNFARVNVQNLSSTNAIDNITNIDIINYNTNMSSILTNLKSSQSAVKEQAYSDFVTNNALFPWQSTNSISLEYGESELFFRTDCGNSIVIKIVKNNNFIATADLPRKYYYGILKPINCGYDYTISITN